MQLLKDRNLNIAIVISAFWHLVCMVSIYPILATTNFRENSTTISFLGSILQKVIAIPEKTLGFNKFASIQSDIEKNRAIPLKDLDLMPPEKIEWGDTIRAEKEKFILPKGKNKEGILARHYRNKENLRFYFKDILVSGEAKNRMLLYRPDLYNVSIFHSGFDSDSIYNVIVRFNVSRHGFVERPECIVSSGSPEIDRLAIRYVRKWQFVPYYGGDKEGQEGIVRFTFRNI